ncbi:hypothetical protein Daus18300_005614 [Diaporthe australafricana]|uniref:Integral membrane protein n=1 Tax=Diaporthe australafricana TaxID=127596 RepID=A0ABR3X0H7_9PEZI
MPSYAPMLATKSAVGLLIDLSKPLYWTIIEANLVLIAACIPVLQPIIDAILGRSVFTPVAKRSSREYEDYSESAGPSQPKPDAIEMFSKPKKKHDKYGYTVQDPTGSRIETDSQRQIMDGQEGSIETENTGDHSVEQPQSAGILRTADFSVTYEEAGENGPTSASRSWAPV